MENVSFNVVIFLWLITINFYFQIPVERSSAFGNIEKRALSTVTDFF